MPADPPEVLDPIAVALAVGRALERVGADYFLGGSLASSLQGEPRSTNDIDLVVNLREPDVAAFAVALGPDFDVDEGALRESLGSGGSWNIFHLPSMMKIDLFTAGRSPFDRSEFARRRRTQVTAGGDLLWVKSAEDSVLRKLRWYLDGGRVSDRQWRDVVQILRVNEAALDAGYLDQWAPALGIVADLARARCEAEAG
jgi:hypothetical protein